MNLEIKQEERENTRFLMLSGEVDAYTAPQLTEALNSEVQKEGQSVVVDLSDVQYMDSTGLGVFIGALKKSQQANSHMTLTNPQKRVARLFTITGLSEVMDIRQEGEVR